MTAEETIDWRARAEKFAQRLAKLTTAANNDLALELRRVQKHAWDAGYCAGAEDTCTGTGTPNPHVDPEETR